jgi:hypothetical protein
MGLYTAFARDINRQKLVTFLGYTFSATLSMQSL